jgi:type I restriction enzyme S subunit
MPRANWRVLEHYPVVVPAADVAKQFASVLSDALAEQQALIRQVQNLRRTRDLLLPRLLSGHIVLKDAAG